ncbi:SDR family oxidoreductase [Candidatus Peregrinibacteria bacterium]|jgi:3-oxoacyl-[acyl-carrier protein] reductase|nr:SDR family oxidoreductase [Candidatus Peregrinibacteria bacterium]
MFNNQSVFISGGAQGIGAACSRMFAQYGAKVLVNYKNSKESAEKLKNDFPENIEIFHGDMSNSQDISSAFDAAEKFGGKVSILINNAGIVGRIKFPNLDKEDFLNTLAINTIGPYLVSKEFASRAGSLPGSIVNIGSMRVFDPTASSIDYSASKAALHNMTLSLAKTLAPKIRVNAVAPGFTKTNMHQGNFERLESEAKKSLLQRYSSPEDIAESVVFLSSLKAQSITGQILLVDNGRSLGL